MGRVATPPPGHVQTGTIRGIVIELGNGHLLCGTYGPFSIMKSTDNGQTWARKYFDNHPNRNVRLNYLAKNGDVFFGTNISAAKGYLMKSSDQGETWTRVLLTESSGVWYMVEDKAGNYYVSEYSSGTDTSLSTYYGLNIWKSSDHGNTFSKFFSADRSIRHIHVLAIDTRDRLWVGIGHGPQNGLYPLNKDGTLGPLVLNSNRGQGAISFVEAEDGKLFFGQDTVSGIIARVRPSLNADDVVLDLESYVGTTYDTEIFSLVRGRDSVLYGVTNGNLRTKLPYILASHDNGQTWLLLQVSNKYYNSSFLSINTRGPSGRLYMDQEFHEYLSIPDYTRKQIRHMYNQAEEMQSRMKLTGQVVVTRQAFRRARSARAAR